MEDEERYSQSYKAIRLENKELSLSTGKKCTISGEWETDGKISTIVYISKGEIMPAYCGKNVKWILVRKG